jgi:hypothetical protein
MTIDIDHPSAAPSSWRGGPPLPRLVISVAIVTMLVVLVLGGFIAALATGLGDQLRAVPYLDRIPVNW